MTTTDEARRTAEDIRDRLKPPPVLPAPNFPAEVARQFVAERYTYTDEDFSEETLRHWRGGWWQWTGPRWVEVEQSAIRSAAYAFTENAVYLDGKRDAPWAPTKRKISDLLDALAAIVHLSESVPMPSWLDQRCTSDLYVSVADGLLNVDER